MNTDETAIKFQFGDVVSIDIAAMNECYYRKTASRRDLGAELPPPPYRIAYFDNRYDAWCIVGGNGRPEIIQEQFLRVVTE